jgi:exopolyphosphatase/pppGpp-phosphohydrolase
MSDLPPTEDDAIARVHRVTDWMPEHGHQVARLAHQLFQSLAVVHGLDTRHAALLRAAALLHDVGYPIGPDDHHRTSARIIRSQLGLPFHAADVAIVALLARYHRKALPSIRHRRFSALSHVDQRMVGWLAGILRVADGLDRAHRHTIESVTTTERDGQVVVRPFPRDGASDDDVATAIRGARRKRDLLERSVGGPIRLAATG